MAYALRAGACLAVAAAWAKGQVAATLAAPDSAFAWDHLMDLVGQLDVYHALFFALLPVAAILLFLPRRRQRSLGGGALALWAVGAGALVAGAVYFAPRVTRPDAVLPPGFGLAAVWLGANVGLLTWFHFGDRWTERSARLCRRAVFAADLLAPMLVWSAYRRRVGAWLAPWRVLPAVALLAMPILPWVLHPLPVATALDGSANLRLVMRGTFNQLTVDPLDGTVIAVEEATRVVTRLDPRRAQGALVQRRAFPDAGSFFRLGFDWTSRRAVLVDPAMGRTRVLDLNTFSLVGDVGIDGVPFAVGAQNPCGTYWHAATGALYAFCPEGLLAMCPDGRAVRAWLAYPPGELLFHPTRPELAMVAWLHQLLWLNQQPPAIRAWTPKPYLTERGVWDAERNRLLITLPIESALWVVNVDDPADNRRATAFPGVRTINLDPEVGLLLGGFSPVLEVRSPDDFSLIDRFTVPPWSRMIAVDAARKKAYLACRHHGLWELDLAPAGHGAAAMLRRLDPFYPLVNVVARTLLPLIGYTGQVVTVPPDKAVEHRAASTCSDGVWTEPD